ncbi:hypothetical protein IGI37_001286 [Enterococcus sp. AZ194]|uniref:bacteriocin n=1 Tax=Enterococcus sp. AZ194 TaxID=2774629 RepID=UPI003F2514E7
MKKLLIMVVMSLGLIGGTAVFANEIVTQVQGGMEVLDGATPAYESSGVEHNRGWWRRGHDWNRNISEYEDYSKQGHGSCENGNGTFDEGKWVPAYQWSKASVGWTLLGGNKAYYNYR